MINQVWLKTFCTLVEVGHFTRTADKLFMTQSGVSQHIKKLEQQIGMLLLMREGKSFTLTEAGNQLFEQGQPILAALSRLEDNVKQDDLYSGSVRIASPGSIGLRLYPLLLDIQAQHAKLAVDYVFAPNKDIEQAIAERRYDLGLMTQRSTMNNVVSQPIADEPLVLVTSSQVTSTDFATLLSLGFISHPDANHHCQLLLSENYSEFSHATQFEQRGFSNQISLILEPISRGIGFTVLPLYAAQAFHQQDSIRIHHLPNSVNETLFICSHQLYDLPKRIINIREIIAEHLQPETRNT